MQLKSYCHLKSPMFGCLFLIGQEIWQKFSYNSLIANPSAFQNGMTLENRVKIGRAMSKNVRSSNFFWKIFEIFKNFRGLFGALKLKIFSKKRYFGVTLDRHYPILRSKSKSKKLTAHWLFFGPQEKSNSSSDKKMKMLTWLDDFLHL